MTAAVQADGGGSGQLALEAVQELYNTGQPAGQAVVLLQQVFGQGSSDATAIATTMQAAGYHATDTLTALRDVFGPAAAPTATQARALLSSPFGVTAAPDQVNDLMQSGYAFADIVTALGTQDPVTLGQDLQGTPASGLNTLIQLFGPSGQIDKPLALAGALVPLGVSGVGQATAIMQTLGFTNPAQVGSLLWSDGFSLAEVAGGAADAITYTGGSFWTNALMKVLVQMTGCASPLDQLPACASGASTFTPGDAIQALTASLAPAQSPDCGDAAFCALIWQAVRGAGASLPDTMTTLMAAPFAMPRSQVGANLENLENETAASQVAATESQDLAATPAEVAQSLTGTDFQSVDVGNALQTLTGSQETTSIDLKDAGYSAVQIAYWLYSVGASRPAIRSDITTDLRAIGFDYSDAESAAWTVDPLDPAQFMSDVTSETAGPAAFVDWLGG